MEYVEGLDALVQKLERLAQSAAPKAATAGCRAGMAKIATALRSAVNGSSAPDSVKSEARKTIASRLVKSRDQLGMKIAKVGYGVGKRDAKLKTKAAQKAHARYMAGQGGGHAGGVGMSKSNIHWFVMGTQKRYSGVSGRAASGRLLRRRLAKGVAGTHYTGSLPAFLAGTMKQAVSSAGDAALAAARAKIEQVIAKEAQAKG